MTPEPQAIPEDLPVMTIPGLAFFPHSLLPIYIFEPRYKAMLSDVSKGSGLFVIAQLDPKLQPDDRSERPCEMAGIGLVKACEWHPDGTANIVVQGLIRAQILEIVREKPYRIARVLPVQDLSGDTPENLTSLGNSLRRLVERMSAAATSIPSEAVEHIRDSGGDPAALADTISAYLVRDGALRRRLLECPNTAIRMQRLQRYLRAEVSSLEFEKHLRGGLPESEIGLN